MGELFLETNDHVIKIISSFERLKYRGYVSVVEHWSYKAKDLGLIPLRNKEKIICNQIKSWKKS